MPSDSGYCRFPTIQGDTVVFVSDDDLWSVPVTGGPARRLTASPGTKIRPVLSPDGKWLAYTGMDEGQPEVWCMPAEGGAAERLTWLGGWTMTLGWRPDSSSILLASDVGQPFMAFFHGYEVAPAGGPVEPLGLGNLNAITFQPDGPGTAIGRNTGDPARWKRYRGGTAGTLWVDTTGKGKYRKLVDLEGNLGNPMWVDGRIWFISDHEGCGNVYSVTKTGRGITRHTDHEEFYARFAQSDGKRIVYSMGADVWLLDPETGENRMVDVSIQSARPQRGRKFVDAANYLQDCAPHPEGHSIAITARGKVFSFPLWEEAVTQSGKPHGVRYRLAQWLPDGKKIVALDDTSKDGEELVLLTPGGSKQRVKLDLDLGRADDMVVAPAGGSKVAIANHRNEVIVVDLAKKKAKVVDTSGFGRCDGMAWSPDGRWLAYSKHEGHRTIGLKAWDSRRNRGFAITRPEFQDTEPAFSPDGKYLFFISYREFNPVYDQQVFDLGFPRAGRLLAVPLTRDLPSPFVPTPRAPGPATPDKPDDKGKGKDKKKDEKVEVKIDFAGIEDRVVGFPIKEGTYGGIAAIPGKVLFLSHPMLGTLDQVWVPGGAPSAKATLECWDLVEHKQETLVSGVTDFTVSGNGKVLVVRAGNRLRALAAGSKPDAASEAKGPGRESGWLDLSRVRLEIDPPQEWEQMYHEAWRLMRDQFWVPDMSGVDWDAVRARYLPLLAKCATRGEFSDLMWEMQGEMGTSHAYEFGGDYRPSPSWIQGHLGADFAWDDGEKCWRVAKLPAGDSWNEKWTSPLAAPGVNVAVGDRIVSVAGQKLGKAVPPGRPLVHQAGQYVSVQTADADGKKRKTHLVKAMGVDSMLRYRDWVEGNRAYVHKQSKGKVGYVHIPDMGARGYAEFHRYFRTELDHDGLVIDVRFNGGGHVSQILLEKLLRRRVGYDMQRWSEPLAYPGEAPQGPMVALTNERAGSDGDIFSHCFKLYGLGPLIGKRTWGGVIGIWPRHELVDGTITTQPEFSFWFTDVGFGVENYGTDPDIEVEILPHHYAEGKDPQMDRGLREIKRLMKESPPLKPDFAKRPNLARPRLPKR